MAAFEGEGSRTADQIVELDVVTGDGVRMKVGRTSPEELKRIVADGGRRGEIYAALAKLRDEYADLIRKRFPDIPRRVSGYNLPFLLPENGFHLARALAGSEGTCVTVLEAALRLIPNPKARTLLVAGFLDVAAAADAVPRVLAHRPIGLEGFDGRLAEDAAAMGILPAGSDLLPPGRGWLLIELGGESREESQSKARRLAAEIAGAASKVYTDANETWLVWRIRESALGATAHPPGRPLTWEGWEDSAGPPERLGGLPRGFGEVFKKHGYESDILSHLREGCLHTAVPIVLGTER